jgi:intein/homing endonuclease
MNNNFDSNNFFNDFISDMTAANLQSAGNMSIIEFANRIIFNNDSSFQLYPTQKAILKSFYREPLNEEELTVLNGWVDDNRSTWVKDRHYISLVLEAGRRASKCNAMSAYVLTTIGTITYGELHQRLANNEKIGIYTYDIKNKITKGYATYDIKTELNAVEQTYKITTETNKTEIVNLNHPFLTCEKDSYFPIWKELKNLQVGNYIATSSEIPIFGDLEKSDEELNLWALALTNLVTNKQKVYDKYHLILSKTFNSQDIYQLNLKLKQYRKSINKEEINRLSKNSTIIFLRYLLEINTRREVRQDRISSERAYTNNKYSNKQLCEVSIQTHKFRKEIALQFLKLGISTYYIQEESKDIRGISICNTNSINRLIEIFGWDIYKGKLYLQTSFTNRNLSEGGATSGIDRFDRQKDILENQYPTTNLTTLPDLNKHYKYLKKGRKHILAQEALNLNNEKLYDWATNSINWEKITSIEPYKIEQTIALEVKDTHIIGGPIISHNSTMASIIALKEFYDLIIHENPQRKYNILDSSPIAILVMAQSQAQVKETIFAAMRGYAENSRFFTSLQNKGQIEILSEEIRCKAKNVAIYAKHTNSKSLVGYTVKAMILDEVARFETLGEDGKNKAFEIWDNVGCHKEDNLIYSEHGAYPAKHFLNNHPAILTYDLKTGKQYYTKDYKCFDNKIKQVSRIETNLGRFVEVTEEHPFLVWDPNNTEPNWKERKDLKIGDCIAINLHNKINFKNEPTYNPALSKILGYLISDANITKNKTSIKQRFINTDQNIINDFNNCLKNWDDNYYLKQDNKSCTYKYVISRYIKSTKNNLLIDWLKEINIAEHNALTKFVPDYLFQASKTEITNFIAGLFMGDGTIPNFKNPSKIYIEYNSISKKLIYQLQELLLQINILSYIRKKQKGNYNSYQLIISNTDSILKFYKEIPIISYKKDNLKTKINLLKNRSKYKKDKYEYLPIGFKKLILKFSKNKIEDTSYYGKKLNNIKTTFNKAKSLDINEAFPWLNKNIGWDYIKSIEDLRLHNTIGFSVANTNVIGGSIITHNSGGITFGSDFKKVAISSAWEPGDPIEAFYDTAQKNPNSLAFKLTTFQINLDIKKSSPSIQSEYINDFIKARREFEGIRFTKFNTFIEINNLNKACRSVSVIDSIPSQIESITAAGTQYYAGITLQRITPNQINDNLSFIHVDPALKKDSAALAIARPIQEEGKWKIQIDALLKWEPHTDNKGNKRIVSFIDIEEKLIEITKVRKTGKITFDSWNSAALIQKLNSLGIDAQQVSCSREMQFTYYTLFRDLLAHDYIVLPKDSSWTNNAITELSELVLKANKQIIHPTAGKDLADAIVNAIYQCNQYMIKAGLNLSTGLHTHVIQSKGLAPLQKITVSKFSTNNLKIGGAIDKLYKKKF